MNTTRIECVSDEVLLDLWRSGQVPAVRMQEEIARRNKGRR